MIPAALVASIAVIALFSFSMVATWSRERRREREAYYRSETLKRVADAQPGGGQFALEFFREEQKVAAQSRRESLKLSGLITVATALGLMAFIGTVRRRSRLPCRANSVAHRRCLADLRVLTSASRVTTMGPGFRAPVICCCLIIAALLVVGAVSHGVIRHIVQTSPLWIAIVLGARNSAFAKWAALPCFVFWLALMTAIWLYLLGWARLISGTFSATEIAMTIIVGLASVVGIVDSAVPKSPRVRAIAVIATVSLVLVLQVAAFRVSLLPQIAHR